MERIVNTWEYENYKVRLGDYEISHSKYKVSYEFYKDNSLLFCGNDFFPSPIYKLDQEETILGLLGFLTLKPEDTDDEYFDNYNQDQLDWSNSWECELLQCYIYGREEELNNG